MSGPPRNVCMAVVQFTRLLFMNSRTRAVPNDGSCRSFGIFSSEYSLNFHNWCGTSKQSHRYIQTVTAPGNMEPERRNLDKAMEDREKWRKRTWDNPSSTNRRDRSGIGLERNDTRSHSQHYKKSSRYSDETRSGESVDGPMSMSRKKKLHRTTDSVTIDGFMERTGVQDPARVRIPRNNGVDEKDIDNKPKTAYDMVRKLRSSGYSDTKRSPHKEEQSRGGEKRKANPVDEEPDNTQAHPTLKDRVRNADRRTDIDSKGFSTYGHLVPDWDRLTAADVLHILEKAVIYDEHGVVAINKPYGLPVHGGPTIHHHVAKYLPDLAEALDPSKKTKLHLIHRIDKETTGVLLLARDEKVAAKLQGMFVHREIKKHYVALVRGVPDPLKGVVEIPIGDSRTTGVNRRVLRPVRTQDTGLIMKKSSLQGSEAVTEYEVVAATGQCSLLELHPRTGVQHQIRIHLSHALGCPVLGDHKYSHFSKLAPQKLPRDLLKRLKMRQAKVRTLPMFLHASSVTVPEFVENDNVHISCELPSHFRQIMSRLKIKRNNFEE